MRNPLDFSLRKALLGVKWYVERLEQSVIEAVGGVGLEGVRSPHTGVWLNAPEEKVCAVGVHNSGLVTSHGLALNCCVDLVSSAYVLRVLHQVVASITKDLKVLFKHLDPI
jgi:lipoate-protein ligase B